MLVPPVILIRWSFFAGRKNLLYYLYHMKNSVFILSIVCALTACNHPNKEIKERIMNADSVAINYFKGDGTMDTVVAIKIISDKQKIEQLVILIAAQRVEGNYKCGYDGSLHFFKMNKVIQDIDFRMNEEDCMYFSFMRNGKPQATALSKGAKELINSFRKTLPPVAGGEN